MLAVRQLYTRLRRSRLWKFADVVIATILIILTTVYIIDNLAEKDTPTPTNDIIETARLKPKTVEEKAVFVPIVYGVESARELESLHLARRCKPVPKRMHQVWKDNMVPIGFKPQITKWMQINDEWEYWFWTEAIAEEFMMKRFPKYHELYASYPLDSHRINVIRYFILYAFGGIFADMDVAPVVSWDKLFGAHTTVISKDHPAHTYVLWNRDKTPTNAVMMSSPNHTFFKQVIEKLPKYSHNTDDNDVLGKTGSFMLEEVIRDYTVVNDANQKQHFGSVCDAIYLTSHEMFAPTFDDSKSEILRHLCKNPGVKGTPKAKQCAELASAKFKNGDELPTNCLARSFHHHILYDKSDHYHRVRIQEMVRDNDFIDANEEVADLTGADPDFANFV
ncbi:uncharacterized protein LOC141907509 [Tubulanus polymorphus]|uniref:uncharacterized protein LOC141907509 n=1 Tax=Tubulanus polymorphus TaxID=672921 RepID=UPI003DA2EFC7